MGTNGGAGGWDDKADCDGRFELRDVVEPALARALVLAAEAGRWGLVERIAGELEARRQARDECSAPVAEAHRPARSRRTSD
jgi:hypothetical protein